MALTKISDVFQLPETLKEIELSVSDLNSSVLTIAGDVQELELSVSQLSASVTEIALDVSELSASVLSISEDVEKLMNYSETEEVIGEWTDGSTLYRKVFNISSVTTGDNNIPHNITNLDKVISIDGTFSAFGYQYNAPAVSGDTNNSLNLSVGSENIIATVGMNISSALTRLTIVLTYTKLA